MRCSLTSSFLLLSGAKRFYFDLCRFHILKEYSKKKLRTFPFIHGVVFYINRLLGLLDKINPCRARLVGIIQHPNHIRPSGSTRSEGQQQDEKALAE